MRHSVLLILAIALICSSCEDDPECITMCDKLNDCGFLPSPLGSDRENCVARCENSLQMRDSFNACAQGQNAQWTEQASDEVDDPSTRTGCSKIASCVAGAVGASDAQGYGTVMVIPTNQTEIAQGATSREKCEPAVTPDSAAGICAGWNMARATLILSDEEARVDPTTRRRRLASITENTCATTLMQPPRLKHVLVGRLRAELVLQGDAPDIGAAGAPNMGTGGVSSGNDGVGGAQPVSLAPCVVFSAPTQINSAGSDCVGILLPFDADISKAKVCERDTQCSDNLDNDEDGWTDCDDPKCAAYCAHLMSVAPPEMGGAGPAE